MKNFYMGIIIVLQIGVAPLLYAEKSIDLTEPMKQSLVYLEISNSRYEQYQPWKQTPITKDGGYGCAVGPYEILTTAENVADLLTKATQPKTFHKLKPGLVYLSDTHNTSSIDRKGEN